MKKLLTVVCLLALVTVFGVTAWWFFIASFGDRQIQDFIAKSAKDGVTISVAETERSGFPMVVQWRLRGVRVAQQSADGALDGDIPGLRIDMDVFQPQNVTFETTQPPRLKWSPANGAPVRTYTAQAGEGDVRPMIDAPGWRLTGDLRDVQWKVGQGGPEGATDAVSIVVRLPPDRRSATFDLTADDVDLSEGQVFGKRVETVRLAGAVDPMPRALTPAGLIHWQQSGGSLTIDQSSIVFGALRAGAAGQLALDRQMRPAGRLKFTMMDPQAIVTIASREGWVKPDELGLIQLGLGLVTRRNAAGEPEVNTTLDMRKGGLWIGPVRLANLPPVAPAR